MCPRLGDSKDLKSQLSEFELSLGFGLQLAGRARVQVCWELKLWVFRTC